MKSPVTSRRWQQFLKTLSQILNINLGVVDESGKLIVSFLNANKIDDQDYFQLLSDYKIFFYNIIDNIDSNIEILTDPFGLLIAIVPLADNNYLILGGIQEKASMYDSDKLSHQRDKHKEIKKSNIMMNSHVLISREELKLKAESAKKLYNQLINMTKERNELGEKMMLLTALEEYNKLLLSLIQPEIFNIKPLLDLISSSLIILFDADASWVFSHCNNQ